MTVNNVSLAAVGVKMSQYPIDRLPEIAFAGKSNVGKSSLINTMIQRKALARTSQSPGKTRTINFYNVENMLYFVDLPGYGYAKASKTDIEKWGKMIEEYLGKRETLKSIVLLIDIRHEPSKNDKIMYDFLSYYGYRIIVALTKLDKISKNAVQKHISMIKKGLDASPNDIFIPFSSETKIGREQLWKALLDEIIEADKTE